ERVLAGWPEEHEAVLDLLADAADPDLALAALDRLAGVREDLPHGLSTTPVLGRQLTRVLGASAALGAHLLAHPEQIELLTTEVTRTSADGLRAELLSAVGADPASSLPEATDLSGDGLRLAY